MLVHACVRTGAAPDIAPASARRSPPDVADGTVTGDVVRALSASRADLRAWHESYNDVLCLGDQASLQVLLTFLTTQLRASGLTCDRLAALDVAGSQVAPEHCRALARELSTAAAALALTARRGARITADRGGALTLAAEQPRVVSQVGDARIVLHPDGRIVLDDDSTSEAKVDLRSWELEIASVGSRTTVTTGHGRLVVGSADAAAALARLAPAAQHVTVEAVGYAAAFVPLLHAWRALARRAAELAMPLRIG